MTMLQALLVAVVQGLTEFLPVSSSGHMVLMEKVLGVHNEGAVWEVALHLGTLVAVCIVFRRELKLAVVGFLEGLTEIVRKSPAGAVWRERDGFRLGFYLVIGTIPAAVIGLALGDRIEAMFDRPLFSAAMIFMTGEILWLSRPHSLVSAAGRLRASDSALVGLAQAVALLPGVSRSGATISMGLMRGIERETAARFGFLLSVPAILGGTVLQARKLKALPPNEVTPLLVGVLVAAVSGYIALRFLLRVVRAGKLHYFSYYCWTMGVIGVVLLWGLTPVAD